MNKTIEEKYICYPLKAYEKVFSLFFHFGALITLKRFLLRGNKRVCGKVKKDTGELLR